MTPRQTRIIKAINEGHTTVRQIAAYAGISSTSVVASNLQALHFAGEIVLEQGTRGEEVYTGADFCAAWDSAARLAGNPNA